MYDLTNICWICVSYKKDLRYFSRLSEEFTYFFKLTATLPEMRYKELNDQRKICDECCDNIDIIYNFRQRCLRSKVILTDYILQRSADKTNEIIEITSANPSKGENKIEEVYIKQEVCDNETEETNLNSTAKTEQDNNFTLSDKTCDDGSHTAEQSQDMENKELTTPVLDRHKLSTSRANYQCETCHKSFPYRSGFVIHQRIHSGERPYACASCGKSFSQKHKLKLHMLQHYGRQPHEYREFYRKSRVKKAEELDKGQGETSNESKTSDQPNVFLGHFLTSETSTECSLEKEPESQASESQDPSSYVSSELEFQHFLHTDDSYDSQKSKDVDRPYECEFCHKMFSKAHHLKQHQVLHTGSRPFQCRLCGKKFSHVSNMKQHEHTHSDVKPYQCADCDKKFSLAHHLRQHQITHSGEKNYECTVCQKKFSHYSNMKQHLLIHSGVRPFRCEYENCDKAFSVQRNLKRHHLSHNEKLFQCKECLKKFTFNHQLMRHQCSRSEINSDNTNTSENNC